jgi:acyl-CoA synthetase (NDP forming)
MSRPALERLFNPRSLAIVGANDKGNSGAQALKNAIEAGFSGPIWPVNPNYETLEGLKCYPSLVALPGVPDTAVVAAPVKGAMTVLDEAAAAGIKSAVFFAGGFTDAGTPEGRARHDHLVEVAKRNGMAISGPNCMGLLSRKNGFASSFVRAARPIEAGPISIVSQSGGLINALLELGANRALGFNYLISAGNEAVVNTAHYLDMLADDPGTEVIISILEGVKDGPHLRAALARATARKPVVMLKLGRSDAGQQATLAHTGSLAGSDEVFAAACRQAGAVLVETLDAALEAAALLARVPLPKGGNVVIFSSSGGATVLTTDLATKMGLRFPPLTPKTNARLQEVLGAERPFINPFDVGSLPLLATRDNMTQCLNAFLDDDEVHVIGCVLVVQRDPPARHRELMEQVRAVAARAQKPIIIIPEMVMHWRETPLDPGTHVSSGLLDGLVALRGLVDYAAFRRRPTAAPVAAAPAANPIAAPKGRKVLTEYESKKLLAGAGLPVTTEELVQSVDEAVAAARRIGYPVALKVQSPDLMHKTDAGGLELNLGDDAALRSAYARLVARTKVAMDGILVQEMVEGGVEFLLGMKRDAVFGPVVVVSPGGVFVDLFENSGQLCLPPFGPDEAARMLERSSVAGKLLAGFRGRPPADRAALIDVIARFAALVAGLPTSVAAIDLNPVIVLPKGQGVRIVDAAVEFS